MEKLTYLALIAAWAVPVLALEWWYGGVLLRRAWRPITVAVAMATAYMGLADVAALHNGIFEVSDDRSLPLRGGSFVLEDWVFLLVTNLAIAQAAVLLVEQRVTARWWRRLRGR